LTTSAAPDGKGGEKSARGVAWGRRLTGSSIFIAYALVVLSFVAGEIAMPGFAKFGHIMTVLQSAFFLGMVTLGQMIVLVSGREGIDLSVGAIFTMGVVVSASVIGGNNAMIIPAVLVVLALGFGLGLVNGLGVALLGIAPLIMTLGWGIAVEGIAYFSTGGFLPGRASPILETVSGKSMDMSIGSSRLAIPYLVPIWLLIATAAVVAMSRTRAGFVLYATGANERTARLVGVRTRMVIALSYAVSGMFAALAGLFMLGYVGRPNLGLGNRYILPSVVSAIIGGVALSGGAGSYAGAAAGAVFLTSLISILTTLGLGESARQMIVGAVLILLLISYARKPKA